MILSLQGLSFTITVISVMPVKWSVPRKKGNIATTYWIAEIVIYPRSVAGTSSDFFSVQGDACRVKF